MKERQQVRRVTWKQAKSLEMSSVVVSAFHTLTRSYPSRVHGKGGLLYSCEYDASSIPRKWFGRTGGSQLEFIRSRWYSTPIAWSRERFVVRPYIAEVLKSKLGVEYANAKCVGVIDLDLLDYSLMEQVTSDSVGFPDYIIKDYIDRYGVYDDDSEWIEILPPTPSHGDHLGGKVFDHPIMQLDNQLFSEKMGLMCASNQTEPFKMQMLNHFGMVLAPFHVMRMDIAEIIIPCLPPQFWVVSYWEIY